MKKSWAIGTLGIILFLFIGSLALAGSPINVEISDVTIIIDGNPDDWAGIPAYAQDPMDDLRCETGPDLKAVYFAKDSQYLYWRMDSYSGEIGSDYHPTIHFYQNTDGKSDHDIQVRAWGDRDSGVIWEYTDQDGFVKQYTGSEFGKINSVAEGKIPLSFFSGKQIIKISAHFYNRICTSDYLHAPFSLESVPGPGQTDVPFFGYFKGVQLYYETRYEHSDDTGVNKLFTWVAMDERNNGDALNELSLEVNSSVTSPEKYWDYNGGYWWTVTDSPLSILGKQFIWTCGNQEIRASIPDDVGGKTPPVSNIRITGGTESNPVIAWDRYENTHPNLRNNQYEATIFAIQGENFIEQKRIFKPLDQPLIDFSQIDFEFLSNQTYQIRFAIKQYLDFKNITAPDGVWMNVVNRSVIYWDYELAPCTYSISPTSGNFPTGGGTDIVKVTTSDPDCTWTASENLSWASLSPTSGGGSQATLTAITGAGAQASVTVTVDPNTGDARNGSAAIAGYPYNISQVGASDQTAVILTRTSPNHTITSGSDVKVYGTAVSNQITLESGAQTELINFPGFNTVQFQSSADGFTVSRSGQVVTFQGADGTVLKIPANQSVQTITFAGQEPLTLSSYNNQVMLDDLVVSNDSNDDTLSVSIGTSGRHGTSVPLAVTFTADISGGIAPYSIVWDFDENGIFDDVGEKIEYVYEDFGTFMVKVAVYDANNGYAESYLNVEIGQSDNDQIFVVPSKSTKIGLSDGANVFVPEGTFSNETILNIKVLENPQDTEDFDTVGKAYDIFYTSEDVINGSIQISLPYDPDVVSNENKLAIYQWREDLGKWFRYPSYVDKQNHTVSADVDHLCEHRVGESTDIRLMDSVYDQVYSKVKSTQKNRREIVMAAGKEAYTSMLEYLNDALEIAKQLKEIPESEITGELIESAKKYLESMNKIDEDITNLASDTSSFDELYGIYEELGDAYGYYGDFVYVADAILTASTVLTLPFKIFDFVFSIMLDKMYATSLNVLCSAYDTLNSSNEIESSFFRPGKTLDFMGSSILRDSSLVPVSNKAGQTLKLPQIDHYVGSNIDEDIDLYFGIDLVEYSNPDDGLHWDWRTNFIEKRIIIDDKKFKKTIYDSKTPTYALIFSFKGDDNKFYKKAGIALKIDDKLAAYKLVSNPFNIKSGRFRNWKVVFLSKEMLGDISKSDISVEVRLLNDIAVKRVKKDENWNPPANFTVSLHPKPSENSEDLELDKTEVTLLPGNMETVSLPDGGENYSVFSDNETVAIAYLKDDYMEIIGLSPGKAKITVKDTSSGSTAIINVNISSSCGAVIDGEFREFDCYNLGADGRKDNVDPLSPSWRLIGGYWQWGRKGPDQTKEDWHKTSTAHFAAGPTEGGNNANSGSISGWDSSYAQNGSWFKDEAKNKENDPCPKDFRVPTIGEWRDVLANNEKVYVGSWENSSTNYDTGLKLGDALFLPAAGYLNHSSSYYYRSGALYARGYSGFYWSSSESTCGYYAGVLKFLSGDAGTYGGYARLYGFSVRCISDDSSQPQALSLGKTTLSLNSGDSETVSISGGSGNYSASSSNSQVATAFISGNNLEITALSSGTATIVVEDTAGESASIDVTVKTSDTEIIITNTDISPAEVPATAKGITLSCYVYAPNGIGHIKSVDFIGKWPAIETGWQLKYQGMDGDSALYTTQIAPMEGASYPYSIPIEFIVTGVDNSTKTANNSLLVWGP